MKPLAIALVASLVAVGGCAFSTQNRYNYRDVGQASVVEFGTVLASRPIEITGENTGLGGVVGTGAGAAIGTQIGQGTGRIAGGLAGAAVGALAGAVIEQALANHSGIEYTIALANGKTVVIAQNLGSDDVVFPPGEPVMVQANGSYQRVLSARNLPDQVARPKTVKVLDR